MEFPSLRHSRTSLTHNMITSMFWVKSDLWCSPGPEVAVEGSSSWFTKRCHCLLASTFRKCPWSSVLGPLPCSSHVLHACALCLSQEARIQFSTLTWLLRAIWVPETQTPSFGFHGNCMHVVYKHICNVFNILKEHIGSKEQQNLIAGFYTVGNFREILLQWKKSGHTPNWARSPRSLVLSQLKGRHWEDDSSQGTLERLF